VLLLFGLSTANALHLALARAEERRSELGVRTALGASRGRLARLLGWEALLVGGTAAGLGLLVAFGVITAAAAWLRGATVELLQHPLRIDGAVVLATATLAALAALLLTAAPVRVLLAQKRRGVLGRRRGSRAGLLVTEVAGAVLLVALASLLARSEALVGRVDKGFSPDGVYAARIVAPDNHYADATAWRATYARLVDAARRLPGVEHAAVTLTLPLSQRSWEMRILPGSGPMDKEKADSVLFNLVSDDSFATLGIPLLRGRGFDAGDREGAPLVAVVDETMAARYWPGQDPLGKQVVLESARTAPDGRRLDEVRTVVGITRNVRHYALERASRIQVYIPVEQSNGRFGQSLELAVRSSGSLAGMETALRRATGEVDPELAISRAGALSRFVDAARGPRRQVARLFTAFGLLALLLAAAGVFAVMTHAVASRQGELGIRSALGADARRLLLHVLGGALTSGALGVVCGALGGALAARALGGMLFGVGGFDARAQLASAGVVLGAVVLAALAPALRAARVQPARLLSAGERIAR
jgi:predicted permease